MKARPGLALVLAILVLVTVDLLAVGLIALSRQDQAAVAARLRTMRARAAAVEQTRATLAAWSAEAWDTLPAGRRLIATGTRADESWAVHVERLVSASWLVTVDTRVGSGMTFASTRATTLIRKFDRLAFQAELRQGIASAGTVWLGAGAVVAAHDSCETQGGAGVAIRASAPPGINAEATVHGRVETGPVWRHDSIAVAGVRWSEFAAIADRLESAIVSPAPSADSVCVTAAPSNWGDPRSPQAMCADYWPLIVATGPLTMRGGVGQGLLVVDGTLTLDAGAHFVGVIVARGRIEIAAGATVRGAVHSAEGPVIVHNARIDHSACAVGHAAALDAGNRVILQRRRVIPAY